MHIHLYNLFVPPHLCCTRSVMFLSCPSRLPSLPNIIFHFFRWNSREVSNTANRLNDYILVEIGTATRKRDTRENSNWRQAHISYKHIKNFTTFFIHKTIIQWVSKNGLLQLISHNFTNSQHWLFIFVSPIPYSILHWLR